MDKFIITSLHSFINTIEISFDYIPEAVINNFNKHVINTNKQVMFKEIFDTLHIYHHEIINITNHKGKLKKIDFGFMDSIKLFTLKLDLFTNENKSTKKNLISHIYNFYYPIYLQVSENSDPEYIKSLNLTVIAPVVVPEKVNPLDSLLGNKDIMSIANDIQAKITNENINPMDILSSLMSGSDGGPALQSLVESVTKNVDLKLENGELNKNDLETQAKKVIDSLGIDTTKDLDMNSITDLFSNLMKQK
jgi:hypothetical protein